MKKYGNSEQPTFPLEDCGCEACIGERLERLNPATTVIELANEKMMTRFEEESLFQTQLAIFINFVEKEAKRIDEERHGAYRRDGGVKMRCTLFLKSFIENIEKSKPKSDFKEDLHSLRVECRSYVRGGKVINCTCNECF